MRLIGVLLPNGFDEVKVRDGETSDMGMTSCLVVRKKGRGYPISRQYRAREDTRTDIYWNLLLIFDTL